MAGVEVSGPISFVGTGANLNVVTDNGLQRAADLLGMSVDEVKNRVTITGAIEIGRNSGVVTVTLLAPMAIFERLGLGALVREQYCRSELRRPMRGAVRAGHDPPVRRCFQRSGLRRMYSRMRWRPSLSRMMWS